MVTPTLTRLPSPRTSIGRGGDSRRDHQLGCRGQLESRTAAPNSPGVAISFGNQPAANNIVEMNSGGKTVGNIIFVATTNTTIQSSGGANLTLDNNGDVSTIDVSGNHTIAAPVVLTTMPYRWHRQLDTLRWNQRPSRIEHLRQRRR